MGKCAEPWLTGPVARFWIAHLTPCGGDFVASAQIVSESGLRAAL